MGDVDERPGDLVVQLAGTIDVAAMTSLAPVMLLAAAHRRRIVLDVGRALGLNCIYLAVLASEIARSRATVIVRGLPDHHARILERLGVTTSPTRPAPTARA